MTFKKVVRQRISDEGISVVGIRLRRWLFLLLMLPAMLLIALPAQAIDYSFPGNLPAGCSGKNGSYSCTALSLAAGDTLSVNVPTTISVNGALAIGANCIINDGGAASDLNFVTVGAITLGASVVSNAILNSGAAIDIGAGSSLTGNLVTNVGAITAGANTSITGNISTVQGAITVGASSTVNGSLSSSETGAITVGANSIMTGDESTVTGDINVGAGTNITGSISSKNSSVTLGASITVTGTVSAPNGTVTSGSGTTVTGTVKASAFDCLETGSNPVWDTTARNPLYTKLVGTNFSFDIAALKADGTLESHYAGTVSNPKYLLVQLFSDTTPATNCADFSNQTPLQSKTISFTEGVYSGAAGRTVTSNFRVTNVAPILRCRVSECIDNSCSSFTSMPPTCSTDQFSVRPHAPTLTTTATAVSPSVTGTPAIAAGASFSLSAVTSPVSAYAGTLKLDTTKLSAQITTQVASQQSGGQVGLLSATVLTANASAISATYGEAGYLYLAPGAYRDDALTAVDSLTGDCILSSAGDTSLSDTLINGKYGCSIGNQTAVSLGRFIPDHFSIAPTTVAAACMATANPFSYFGQDGFVTTFKIVAQNAGNGTTMNYDGAFAKLDLTNYASYGFSAAVLPRGSSLASSATAPGGTWVGGIAEVSAKHQISRPTDTTAPTSILISAAPDDKEVAVSPATAVDVATQLRYGRLKMQNAYGSELLSLPVPLEAQYWNGKYYVTNTDDSCTAIPIPAIVMGNYQKQLQACQTQLSPTGNPTLVAGKLSGAGLVLSKPGAGNGGSVDLVLNLSATATGNTCVSATQSAAIGANLGWFGLNPTARATFGLYRSSIIYMREMY
ncbi:DUF6701 domain-containing protein [Glaciimonas sp. GG7]